MMWLIGLIIGQCVIAVIVIVILLRKLDRELTKAALEKLQGIAAERITDRIIIKTAKALDAHTQGRIAGLISKKSPQVEVIYTIDPAIKGGMVIELAENHIDCSLSGRLRNFWQ